ncbi:MAG: response regulator [Flavobacteriales bacterium]
MDLHAPEPPHPCHILLVDDEDDCNFVTRLVLKKAGYAGKLTCYTAPEDAIEHLRRGEDLPDLMFVDINMPRINGFELIVQCEQEGLLPNDLTTVFMFSSSNRPMDQEKALSLASVRGYVEKALSVDSFERVLRDRMRA